MTKFKEREKDLISKKKIMNPVEYQRQTALLRTEFARYKKLKSKAEQNRKKP